MKPGAETRPIVATTAPGLIGGTVAKKYTLCKCGTRNDRIGGRTKCVSCSQPLRKRSGPKHAQTLRDHSYAVYAKVNADIHGIADESCGVCGKPRSQERHHDRDHDHKTGLPRGLACGGNRGCNVLMLPWITWEIADSISVAMFAKSDPMAERWRLIAAYLRRVEVFYAREAVSA